MNAPLFKITRYDDRSQLVSQVGNRTESETVALLKLIVGSPFGGFFDGKLAEKCNEGPYIAHLLYDTGLPPEQLPRHTLIVELEQADQEAGNG